MIKMIVIMTAKPSIGGGGKSKLAQASTVAWSGVAPSVQQPTELLLLAWQGWGYFRAQQDLTAVADKHLVSGLTKLLRISIEMWVTSIDIYHLILNLKPEKIN